MGRGTHIWLLVALGAALFSLTGPDAAADEPTAAPTPRLALSDKPPPGCCCIAGADEPPGSGCTFGFQEDKCKIAGGVFATARTTWTPGKCPTP